MSANKKSGVIRIIGGQWRGRKLRFPAAQGLRPTGDRNRETLFNWLQTEIAGSRVLDLFAGSGALGLESISRGAAEVQFCELNRQVADALKENLALLNAQHNKVYQGDAFRFLNQSNQRFDLVFIDPPFDNKLFAKALAGVASHLSEHGLVYLEMPKHEQADWLSDWSIVKDKQMGDVRFLLLSL